MSTLMIWKGMALVVLGGLLGACHQESPAAGELPLRRLTPHEYNHAIADLFGYEDASSWHENSQWDGGEGSAYEPAARAWPFVFPHEQGVDGFDGMALGQSASPYLVEQYARAASHFAPLVLAAPRFSTCGRWAEIDASQKKDCARRSVAEFAMRAYRRPLQNHEKERLSAAHSRAMDAWGVDSGTILAVQGILQSPHFLYLVEVGRQGHQSADTGTEVRTLTSWEMASRLSFFLWDTMPDDILFDLAENDRLSTRSQIREQAVRMLADPRAHQAVVHFHRQWLELDQVYENRADLAVYAPLYDPTSAVVIDYAGLDSAEPIWSGSLVGMRRAMDYEAQHFIIQTIFEGAGTLAALLTDHRGFVSRVTVGESPDSWMVTTADLYGVDLSQLGSEPGVVYSLDDGLLRYEIEVIPAMFPKAERAGVLTLGAFLAGRAHPVHPAPIARGKFILERLACEPVGQPPAIASDFAPIDSASHLDTNRQRVELATSAPACRSCHLSINPAGFAFEHYDSLGGYRRDDGALPVDASGEFTLQGEDPMVFDDAVELASALSRSVKVHDCYTKRWVSYALGREVTKQDEAALSMLADSFLSHQGSVQALMVEIATSELFRSKRMPESP